MTPAPDPFELMLLLADSLGEQEARFVVRHVRDRLADGEDAEPWLRAVQLARDAGALSDAAAHYLLDVFIEEATARDIEVDPELREAGRTMDACKAAHGLGEFDDFLIDDAPEEWQAARRRWERRFDRIRAGWLLRLGERAMADELLLRPRDFLENTGRGWREVIDLEDERHALK